MTPRHTLAAILIAVIWGANFVVIQLGLRDMPPLLFVAIRFLAVAFPAVFFVPRPAAGWRAVLAVGATTGLGQFALLYLALHLGMPPGLASLVLQAGVVMTIVIAALTLRERPTGRQLAGVAVGAIGLGVVALGRGEHVPALALLITLAAGLSWACGNVVTRHAKITSGLSLVVWSALVVPVPALALSLLVEGPAAIAHGLASFGVGAALSTLFTAGISSLVGYSVWNSLLARYPASAVTPFLLLVPPVGIASAALFLGETPNRPEVLGAALVLAGVALASLTFTRHAARRPALGPGVAIGSPTTVCSAGSAQP